MRIAIVEGGIAGLTTACSRTTTTSCCSNDSWLQRANRGYRGRRRVLKAARERKRVLTGKCGGNRFLAETRPELVELVERLRHTRSGRQRSLREISAELAARGFVTATPASRSLRHRWRGC